MEKLLIIGLTLLQTLHALVYYINEESGTNAKLGNIATDTNLEGLVNNSDDFKTLRYSFLTQGHPHSSKFRINETSSEIFTKENLDRETICEYSQSCIISLQVSAKSSYGTFFETFDISVHLIDINDNTPYFQTPTMNLTISEASLVGTKYTIESAIDKDSTNFSVTSYEISPIGSPFTVDFTKNLDGLTSTVQLRIVNTLNRESVDSYRIKILAKDGGNPPKVGNLTINIAVSDVNDENPKFSKPLYNVTLSEDVVVNSTILTVSATDTDSGKNGEVTYRISPNQPPEILSMFSIDSKTGDLKIVKQLLYEPRESYKIIVDAMDNGDQPLMSQVFVYVQVLDSGNNPPVININLLSDSNMAEVSEFAKMGAVVAHVQVDDGDTGQNGIVTCRINTNNSYFQLQRIEVNEYKVMVLKPLDRETIPEHFVSIFCQDVGNPPLNSSKNFIVQVLDENDQAPQFQRPTYNTSIPEKNNINDVILHVSASDQDIGINHEVFYQLHIESGNDFTIDRDTGLIRANNTFDRERKDQYKFRVLAIDKGKEPKSSTCTVIVNIEDVNDNAPEFEQDIYRAHVLENLPIDTSVTKVSARDSDIGVNGFVIYSMSPSSKAPFLVFPDGVIKTGDILNREDVPRYSFTVLATDRGNPSLQSSVEVVVDIDDQNDYHPIITYPNATNDTVLVSYKSPINSVVTKVKAHDLDAGPNSDLLYSIKSRNDSDVFNIISTTGEIIVVQGLTVQDMNKKFFLEIAVSDKGLPKSLTSSRNLYIVVSLRNNTTLSPITQQKQDYSVAIAITVVVVTVVLAATIIITIIVIRKMDRQKQKYPEEVVPGTNKNLFSSNKNGLLYSVPGERVTQHSDYNPTHDSNSLASHQTFQRPQSVGDISRAGSRDEEGGFSRSVSPNSDVRQSELTRLASIRLHQQLAQSHDKQWTNQNPEHPVRRPGDNHSDTSGETLPSDSGRGSLDDDHHNMSKSHQSEDFRKYLLHPNQTGRRGTPPHKQNPSSHPHNIQSYSANKIGPTSPQKQTIMSSPRDPPPNHPFYENIHQTRHLPYSGRDHISYGNFQKGLHQRQYLDETMDSMNTYNDDDDNTTTSGSYTIEADDFPVEIMLEKIKDVIV